MEEQASELELEKYRGVFQAVLKLVEKEGVADFA
jgi:hypothetical protein